LKGYRRQRTPGSWEIFIDYGRDPATGKRRQHSETVRGTAADADKRIRTLIDQVERNSFVNSKHITFSDWLKRWYQDYVLTRTRSRTADSYRSEIRNHIVPALGQIRLSRLSPQHLQDYYTKALTSGKLDSDAGLSRRTVLYHHHIISEALKHAVRMGVLSHNPAEMVDPPRLIRREISILAPRNIPRFLEAIWESIYSVLFYTAFATGMRLGELLALTWEDIDLERGFISVTKALSKRGGGIKIEDTKTDYGRRRIEISSSLLRVLREHRNAEQKKGETLGRPLEETDLVFSYPGNRPLDPSTITHKFTEVIRRAGLPHLTFHGMRHSHASILIARGVDIKSVSARLGHASTSFTLDTYGHLLLGSRAAADKFDEAVLSELVRESGREEVTGAGLVSNVSKMLAKDSEKASKKAGIECEPHRNRTCNLLIKSQLLCQLS